MDESTRRLEEAAEALAGQPRRWRALLFAHAPNELGACHSCPGVRWPCRPRILAERAQQLHDARRL